MSVRSVSDLLEHDFLTIKGESLSLADIIEGFHERGFGMVLFIIALPMALPIPVPPGINILMASPLILLTFQQMLGRHTLWLPQKILRKNIANEKFKAMITRSIPWVKRMEFFIRPRLGFITQGAFSHIIGLFGLIMALSVMLPFPLTNTVPSFSIALMSLGVLMRDGLAVIIGALIGLTWVFALVYFAIIFGAEGLEIMKETIKSLLS